MAVSFQCMTKSTTNKKNNKNKNKKNKKKEKKIDIIITFASGNVCEC